MKALCRPYCFLVEGFSQSRFVGFPHIFIVTMPGFFVVMRLLGLFQTIMCHCVLFHLGMGSFMLLMFSQWVMMAIMPRGLLKVDFYFLALLYLNLLQVDWENHEGYTLCVLSVITDQNEAFAPLFKVSPIS
jgi:hypothetical protein